MLTFVDGPAKGCADGLRVQRAPLYLRVVVAPIDEWDCLDQFDDEPEEQEKIFAYRRIGKAGQMHLCCRGRGKDLSGYSALAQYALVQEQPSESVMRDRQAWRNWASERQKKDREKV